MIRAVYPEDASAICDIYNPYIRETTITFEEKEVSVIEMKNRIHEITVTFPWFIYEENNAILGYAYAGKWKGRCAYRHSVELSIYVKNGNHGKGLGSQLIARLLQELQTKEVHAAIAGIALPNEKSIRLHEKFGFTKIAHFHEVGCKFNTWIDVGYWELILNSSARI